MKRAGFPFVHHGGDLFSSFCFFGFCHYIRALLLFFPDDQSPTKENAQDSL
jgi:hypothetical protein